MINVTVILLYLNLNRKASQAVLKSTLHDASLQMRRKICVPAPDWKWLGTYTVLNMYY
jgi:hypothetical protein